MYNFLQLVFEQIKILGETAVEDYPEGDSEMFFTVDHIDVSGVSPSALANSGLLMAAFVADGEEVASVNMVSNSVGDCPFTQFTPFARLMFVLWTCFL